MAEIGRAPAQALAVRRGPWPRVTRRERVSVTLVSGSGPGAEPQGASSSRESVLIVEDDEPTARAVSRLVTSVGFKPRVVSRAREARDVLSSAHKLRALVVDLGLPDGDGFWVAEAARRGAAGLPIVI